MLSTGGLLVRFCPPPLFFAPPPFGILWFNFWEQVLSLKKMGDREPSTILTKDLPHWVVFFLGGGVWCANCQNLRKRQNTHHPQFCTRDVDRRFWGGGAWISRSELDKTRRLQLLYLRRLRVRLCALHQKRRFERPKAQPLILHKGAATSLSI